MADAIAQEKFECPGCGADAHWNPAKTSLVCPFCGTESPAKLNQNSGQVEENDLVATLRSIPKDQRGWKAERVSVLCQSCKAISVFAPERVAQRCDFCGSAQIVPQSEIRAPIRPECVLPFVVSESQVRDEIRRWYGSRWFAPNKLKSGALTDTVHGVYLPYWTFDAHCDADWEAEAGYYYYETETYRDSNGQTKTRQVRKTRWKWTSGHVSHFFDDELVSASKGVDSELLENIEPFPTKSVVPYDAGYVAGWVVEQYQIDLVAAALHSRECMDASMKSLCSRDVPGDTHRNLSVRSHYSKQTFKHVLLPVWLLSYTYGSRNFQVLINSHTGKISGRYPKSWIKIFFLVFTIVIISLIIATVAGR